MGTAVDDYTAEVFHGCIETNFSTIVYSENVKPLMDFLVLQSTKENAFYANYTALDSEYGIMGLYQCRGDLSATECSNCVSTIPTLANQLCGESEESLIQLGGCCLHYQFTTELAEKSVNATKFVEKICKDKKATDEGFWEKMESAFNRVMTGTGIGGFYTGSYEDVNVSGQCQGDLSNEHCETCFKSALQEAKTRCGDSVSGQIYLNKCYISYNGNGNGVPSSHRVTTRVAIAVGIVGVFLLVVVAVIMSRRRRHRDEGCGVWCR
ncbi:hypothetical protein M0R45_037880 [Rubus argutus]|uniref:Gnk2-homologous domain-containing protein n=1 Tax=Rubus argutus TaxID=59490 RepID=A0AAW1W3J5_RUBAR